MSAVLFPAVWVGQSQIGFVPLPAQNGPHIIVRIEVPKSEAAETFALAINGLKNPYYSVQETQDLVVITIFLMKD